MTVPVDGLRRPRLAPASVAGLEGDPVGAHPEFPRAVQGGEGFVHGRVLADVPQGLGMEEIDHAVSRQFRPGGGVVLPEVQMCADGFPHRRAQVLGDQVRYQQVSLILEMLFVCLTDHGFNRPMSELLVSIDLGTTRLKVAAYASDGTLAHLVVRRHEEVSMAAGQRRWQRARRWWDDTVSAMRELLAVLPDHRVLGISLSGRGGAGVFADADGEVQADPWSDGRHGEQARALARWRQDGVWLSNYGLQLIAKYLWLRAEHPEDGKRIRYAFYGKDWLLFRLTGVHHTDWTSGPDAPEWDAALARWDLPEGLLPEPVLPWTLAGGLTAEAARALGLPQETPVAVGAHDGLAANVGAGAMESGHCAITLGTHAVVRMVSDTAPADAYRFYGFPPERHIIGGNAVLAGRAVDWLLEMLEEHLPDDSRSEVYHRHETAAAAVPPGAEGVRFLPFLAGQVAPEHRPDARAAFSGLCLQHGQAHLYRAVLEGAAFAVADIFDQVTGWCGPPTLLRATGGGAESRLWMDMLASILDTPIELSGPGVEGRGAAVCLAVALGRYPDLRAAADAMIRVERVAEPQPDLRDRYREIRARWTALLISGSR